MTDLQTSLFDIDLAQPGETAEQTASIDERFWQFHHANPHVYDQLRDLALELRRAGHTRGGIKMLMEVVRWRVALATTDDSFKLNNNLASRYARLLMHLEPELDGFFATRELRS